MYVHKKPSSSPGCQHAGVLLNGETRFHHTYPTVKQSGSSSSQYPSTWLGTSWGTSSSPMKIWKMIFLLQMDLMCYFSVKKKGSSLNVKSLFGRPELTHIVVPCLPDGQLSQKSCVATRTRYEHRSLVRRPTGREVWKRCWFW